MNIQPASSSSQRTSVSPFVFVLVASLFFLSGSAGLVYQIIWMRTLGLFFGSDIYGIAIILGTFMGGLTLGGLAAGRAGEHVLRPLLWYGAVEIGIGVLALLVPMITQMFDPVLRVIYPQSFDAVSNTYQFVRIALASGAILLPTTLMGATLPLIMRHFVRSRSLLGERAAFFYGINTLGALLGTLVGGFILLPYLGMSATTLCTAAINITIGVCCIFVGRFSNPPEPALTDTHTAARSKPGYPSRYGIICQGKNSIRRDYWYRNIRHWFLCAGSGLDAHPYHEFQRDGLFLYIDVGVFSVRYIPRQHSDCKGSRTGPGILSRCWPSLSWESLCR